MRYLRGYRLEDIPPFELRAVKRAVGITKVRTFALATEMNAKAVAVALPWRVSNAVMARPDFSCPETMLLGAMKRFAFAPPDVTDEDKQLYRDFCRETWEKEFTPIPADQLYTFEKWVEELDVSEARKDELREAYTRFREDYGSNVHPDVMRVGAFCKDEPYVELKAPRWINARDDMAKSFLGPRFQPITDQFADHPWVIKKIPVSDRPRHIYEKLFRTGAVYVGTDYESFEAHFVEWLMEIEGDFYQYMLSLDPELKTFIRFLGWLSGIDGKENVCKMKNFGSLLLLAVRMSGEMNTSLGNTFHNMMMVRFVAKVMEATVKGDVEGDDGLTRFEPPEAIPTKELFARFGWRIKIDVYTELGDASFCGNVFDPTEFLVVTDPIKVLVNMGWSGKRYIGAKEPFLRMLLKSKVMSAAYQYKRVPLIWAATKRLLELLGDVVVAESIPFAMDAFHRKVYREACASKIDSSPPSDTTRALIDRLYNIPIDVQLRVEQQLSVMDLGPFELEPSILPDLWKLNTKFHMYSLDEPSGHHLEFKKAWWREMTRVADEADPTKLGIARSIEKFLRQVHKDQPQWLHDVTQ